MTRRPPMRVEVRTGNTAYVFTSSRILVPILDRLAIKRQYDHEARCWMMPARRVPDLLAYCERDHRPVEVVEVVEVLL